MLLLTWLCPWNQHIIQCHYRPDTSDFYKYCLQHLLLSHIQYWEPAMQGNKCFKLFPFSALPTDWALTIHMLRHVAWWNDIFAIWIVLIILIGKLSTLYTVSYTFKVHNKMLVQKLGASAWPQNWQHITYQHRWDSTQQGTDTETNSGFNFTVASKRKRRVTSTTKSKCHHNTIRLMVHSNYYLDLVHSILGKWVSDRRQK